MESEFMREHEDWLLIAQEDLASAKHLSTVPFMTALFHIQQCAEKALKAYIVFKKNFFTKTHDLGRLIDICMEMDEDFETLRFLAAVLTPYETAGRYPTTDSQLLPDFFDHKEQDTKWQATFTKNKKIWTIAISENK